MLSSLVRVVPRRAQTQPEPEDIFTSSLGLIFTDDAQNFHGDAETVVAYRSRRLGGELMLQTADPSGEIERRKFAHYVWNASLLLAELVGGKPNGIGWRGRRDWPAKGADDGFEWWTSEAEQSGWNVAGTTVLELGAGAGLAGIISLLAGAREVTISDYPAPTILHTLHANVAANVPVEMRPRIAVQGHTWGDVESPFSVSRAHHYSRILAADTLWMAHEHENLVASIDHFLSRDHDARVLITAGFHTGRANMTAFFTAVANANFAIGSIWESDGDGGRRPWNPDRDEEDAGERKKWLVVAVVRRGC